jgi:hypothetical protein
MLAQLDRTRDASKESFERIELQYTVADELLPILHGLFARAEATEAGDAPPPVRLESDDRTNSVLVIGAAADVERVRGAIAALDRQAGEE